MIEKIKVKGWDSAIRLYGSEGQDVCVMKNDFGVLWFYGTTDSVMHHGECHITLYDFLKELNVSPKELRVIADRLEHD